jgi:hypothetical protein
MRLKTRTQESDYDRQTLLKEGEANVRHANRLSHYAKPLPAIEPKGPMVCHDHAADRAQLNAHLPPSKIDTKGRPPFK